MGKVQVVADLHADHWRATGFDPLADAPLEDLDALILAGDIANKGVTQWPIVLEALSKRMDPARIWLIPGNHDYYGGRIDREDKLAEAAGRYGAHLAQKSELIFGQTRFLCCTLWTNMRLGGQDVGSNMRRAELRMNDYRTIRIEGEGYRRLHPLATIKLHTDHRMWLEAELAKPFEGETVVVTHHAPASEALPEKEWEDVPFCYASDLSGMIARYQPDLWCHGHTHHPTDVSVGVTRVLNCSVGYPQSQPKAPNLDHTVISVAPPEASPAIS